MSGLQAIADRFRIEALRGEFTGASNDARLGPHGLGTDRREGPRRPRSGAALA